MERSLSQGLGVGSSSEPRVLTLRRWDGNRKNTCPSEAVTAAQQET